MMFRRLLLFCLLLPGLLAAQGMTYNDEHKQFREPPFEKIYVRSDQICTFPEGVYYFDDYGNSTKVKGICADYDGLYVILVKYECPLCGRAWDESEPDYDFCCPIFHKRYNNNIWCPR